MKGKAFETGGENFKSWNASFNLIHIPLTSYKSFWKEFYKEFAKTKLVVQAWSKILNKKKTIHAYLVIIILVSFQATFALTICKLVQFCTSIFALVCVGINHQKEGDWKGNRVKPFPKWFWWLNCPTQIIGLTSLL